MIAADDSLLVIPANGGAPRRVTDGEWVRIAWGGNHHLVGARRTAENHMALTRIDLATGEQTPIADLGAWPAVAMLDGPAVSGLSVSPDGQTALVSIAHAHGSVWLLKGLQ